MSLSIEELEGAIKDYEFWASKDAKDSFSTLKILFTAAQEHLLTLLDMEQSREIADMSEVDIDSELEGYSWFKASHDV